MRLAFCAADLLALAGMYGAAAGLLLGWWWLVAAGLGLMAGCVLWLAWRAGK